MVDTTSQTIATKCNLRANSSLFTDKRGIRPRTAAAKLFMNKPQEIIPQVRPKSSQLASVKHGIYNPRLPSLRKMDRDTVVHRLSNEHSRHTTYGTLDEFHSCCISPDPPLLHRDQLNEVGADPIGPHERRDWRLVISQPERDEPSLIVRGYIPRKLPYDITSAWRYSLKEDPEIDYLSYNPKPIPATVYSRYRGTWSSTANSKSKPWRY
ncbi:Testis, prostate and placenta-expressed protein-like [Oopsacas minuta]|uniref:Testis, prostate and placenta-expressed protein-like n=1 Tax=Oopsacas minuta TaxID=111878 RepID=A0AAV7KFP3_9METZ|nr:Testis, prostate and placenta-expressed protein-like [Oopsacas minuta]